jgi:hypothetical protein
MKLTINNHRWTIQDSAIYGLCTPAQRLIDIAWDLRKRKRLEIVIHELIHAISPGRSEAKVAAEARELSRALWRYGYRRRKHG